MDVKKASIWCLIIFVFVLFVSAGITIGFICHNAIGQRDIRIRELEQQLTEQTDTIRRCRETVGDISRELNEDITGLQGIIGQLRKIRDRVEDLERCLNNSGDSVPDNDSYNSDSKIVGQK